MPPIDPQYLDDVITATGGAIGVILTALVGAIVLLLKTMSEVKKSNKTAKEAKEAAESVKEATDHVKAETSPNHGGSMKDKVNSTAATADRIEEEMRGLKRDIGRLASVDLQDREAANEAHKQIYESMARDRSQAHENHTEVLNLLNSLVGAQDR